MEHVTINNNETTDIICILDRSTSIRTSGLVDRTIEGFNSFLADQKKETGSAKLTLCLFDGGTGYGAEAGKTYEIIHDGIDIQSVPELNNKTFVPRGMTALFDSIGATIDTVYNRWKDATDRADKVIFLIMTDGEENSSKEYTQQAISDLIKKRKDDDNWVFLFIGANIDTMKVGGGLGISSGNTMSYSNTGHGVGMAYTNMSASVSHLRSATFSMTSTDSLLSDNGIEKEDLK